MMESRPGRTDSFTAGYLWTFGSTALPLVAAFISSLIVARWLGPRVVGLVNWTMALATVLLIAAKFGVDGAASRLVSEYRVRDPALVGRVVRSSIALRSVFTIPVAAAATILAPQLARFFKEPALSPLFSLSGLLILSVSGNELVALLLVGLERFRTLFTVRLWMLVVRVGLVAAAVAWGLGGAGVIGAYAAAALVPGAAAAALLPGVRRGTAASAAAGGERVDIGRRLVRLSVPLAISGASVTVYSMLDKLMLGYFRGASEVGIYSMARNLVETSLFPTFALVMTLRPALAGRFAAGELDVCASIIRRSIRSMLLFSGCTVTVFACLARPIVVGLFTDRFEPSAGLIVLFLPLIVMRSAGSVILPGLIATDRADLYAKLTAVGALLNFALNALFIPRWGAGGAVISTLVSYIPIEALGFRGLARALPGFWTGRDTVLALKIAAATASLVAAFRVLAPAPSGFTAAVFSALGLCLLFTVVMLLLRAITTREIVGTLRSLLPRIGRNHR